MNGNEKNKNSTYKNYISSLLRLTCKWEHWKTRYNKQFNFCQASFAVKDTQSESQNQFFPLFLLTPHQTSKIDEHDENFLDDDFSGSGALGLTQIDRYFNDDSLTTMIQRIQSLSYHYEGRLQLHLIGGFSDNRRISHNLSIALLRKKPHHNV